MNDDRQNILSVQDSKGTKCLGVKALPLTMASGQLVL